MHKVKFTSPRSFIFPTYIPTVSSDVSLINNFMHVDLIFIPRPLFRVRQATDLWSCTHGG